MGARGRDVAYAGSHEWYVISDIWGQGSWFEAFPLRYGGRSDVSQPCEVQLATLSQGSRTLRQAQICCGKRRKLGRSSTPFLGRCDIQGRHPKTGGGRGRVAEPPLFGTFLGGSMVDQRARTCRSSTPISVQIVSRASGIGPHILAPSKDLP